MENNLNYKYYKLSMSRRFSSTISSAMHCRPSKGLGRVMALFAFEGTYRKGCDKSTSMGILGAIPSESFANAEWLNPDQLIQSGRCKCLTAPT